MEEKNKKHLREEVKSKRKPYGKDAKITS